MIARGSAQEWHNHKTVCHFGPKNSYISLSIAIYVYDIHILQWAEPANRLRIQARIQEFLSEGVQLSENFDQKKKKRNGRNGRKNGGL